MKISEFYTGNIHIGPAPNNRQTQKHKKSDSAIKTKSKKRKPNSKKTIMKYLLRHEKNLRLGLNRPRREEACAALKLWNENGLCLCVSAHLNFVWVVGFLSLCGEWWTMMTPGRGRRETKIGGGGGHRPCNYIFFTFHRWDFFTVATFQWIVKGKKQNGKSTWAFS